MQPKLFETALEEAIKFGPAARLVITFPGNHDAMHIHPLAYNRIGGGEGASPASGGAGDSPADGGFRIEIRVSKYDDAEVVDDVIFVSADAIETVELQVKQQGCVWQDEPFQGIEEDDNDEQ